MSITHPDNIDRMTIPVVGIDDGGFNLREWSEVPIYSVYMRGGTLVENIEETSLPIDDDEPTTKIIELIRQAPQHKNLQFILHKGVTIGGLGVIDPYILYSEFGVPVVLIQNRRVDMSHLRKTLVEKHPSQLSAFDNLPPQNYHQGHNLYTQSVGTHPEDIEKLLSSTCLNSKVPEALRLAHMIGGSHYKYLTRKASRYRMDQ